MTTTNLDQSPPDKNISRNDFIRLLRSAIATGSYRFGSQIADHWLSKYPGDLLVNLLHSQSLLYENKVGAATQKLVRICEIDPEFLIAQQQLSSIQDESYLKEAITAQACVVALGGQVVNSEETLIWGNMLFQAKNEEEHGNREVSESLIHKALLEEPCSPLATVMHLQMAIEKYEWNEILDLSELYQSQWPLCVVNNLILADTLIKGGQEEKAVKLLHHTVNLDVAGQVPARLWGVDHAFKSLWPDHLSSTLPFPIPADVAHLMGWNQLQKGSIIKKPKPSKDHREPQAKSKELHQTFQSVQSEFERIGKKINLQGIAEADGRFPAYIILTSKDGLESQYGSKNLEKLHKTLIQVVEATQSLPQWNAYLVFADDPDSTENFGIPPAMANDPWSIKNLISDIDAALFKSGEMIGALLIVGGNKVVPFHHLPNPVDDFDRDVPSDNPYACSDENYFIQNWPVGRLPGGQGDDVELLIQHLEGIIEQRKSETIHPSILERLLAFLKKIIPSKYHKLSFGYSAEIWRRAANAVFRPIGKPHDLVISPPVEADHISKQNGKITDLAYYNLHGLEDSANWYGQRDPIETFDGPDYPIALRPQDIINHGRAPKIVFAESCFGANIIGKNSNDAICLKFLASGTRALVGSTCTSYGAINSPLIAADLLGKAFWRYLLDGYTAGEALRRAKIYLVKEMQKRQGFLDGEDQKTLISFVLYGDPLAQAKRQKYQVKNTLRTSIQSTQVNTICDKANLEQPPEIPTEVVDQVKNIVKNYLPGMTGSNVLYSHDHIECQGHDCPRLNLGNKSRDQELQNRRVITLSKQIQREKTTHSHYARITMNKEGKIIKLAVSK
jgi:hypothetical protein